MKRLFRSLVVAAAVIAPVIVSAAPAATAADGADIGNFVGGGYISPGLGVVPTFQTFNLAAAGPSVGTDGLPATLICNGNGNGLDSVEGGEGTLNLTCAIGSTLIDPEFCVYVHAGAAWVFICEGVVQWEPGVCAFVSSQTPPVTNYELACDMAYARV